MPFVLYLILALVYLSLASRRSPLLAIVKALPIALLLLLVLLRLDGVQQSLVATALLFSLAGDIALALDFKQSFVGGLALFLLAHLFYIAALSLQLTFYASASLPLLLIALFALLYGRRLRPRLGKLRLPVYAYIGAIATMSAVAVLHQPFSPWLIAGALLFMLSDSAIAWHRFLQPLPRRDLIVMSTYYMAQLFLVFGFLQQSYSH